MTSDKKVVLITGGSTGLGFEITKALYQSEIPYELIIGALVVSDGEDAIAALRKETPQSASSLSLVQVDLTSDASLEKAIEYISSQHGRLDSLVNNSGGSFDLDIQEGRMSLREGFNATWNLNVTGTHVLTSLAVPLLLKSTDPRIVFMTSGTSTLTETENTTNPNSAGINDSPPAGWPKPKIGMPVTGYRSTKTALNMLMREWHRILKNDGVKVWAVSPGFFVTGLGGFGSETLKKLGARDPSIGGQFVRDVLQGKRDEDAGKAIRSSTIQPW
ncbi:NAD(P)-binding protein [Daldinia decipiens]|uniref:NAD(P)-binding protein n=1 Tax=Daldinia decipiens TaxID=326647 RepID=UPI0020C3FD71|nr:NAD(P)-binding protein [Daldinia decipiens]KAI1658613.1 NAD(P)-binding protein [Daldinia decipiens]